MLLSRRAITPALLVLALSACEEPKREVRIDEVSASAFEKLGGELGVAIHGSDETFQVLIAQGKARPSFSPLNAPKEWTTRILPLGGTMLPQRPGRSYEGPFAFSPNGVYVAAAIVDAKTRTALPQSVVILKKDGATEVTRIDLADNEVLKAIAWSPDSSSLAVLKATVEGKVSLRNLLASISGHSVPYHAYFLEVRGVDGKRVVQSKLIEGVRASWGEVVWRQRTG